MTPDPKLPPLADMLREKVEQQRRIAGVAKSAGDRLEIEIVAASRALIYADLADALAPYDALIRQQEAAIEKAASCEEELSKCIEEQRQTIRQQEARIAEQALRIEVLQNSARERDAVVEDLEARIAELEQQASDVAEHVFCGWASQEYCESYRKLYVMLGGPDVETIPQAKSAGRIAELEKGCETFRKGFSIANDQAEHVTSLFLPVEAEKDRLAKKVAELEGELADANDELSHWRRLAVAARDALGRSGGLCGMEREQLTASQIIDRLAEMPATEVELAMTSLGVARQNREDLAEFRELAREAHEMSGISNTALNKLVLVPDLALRISYRLAARHKEE